MCVDKATTVPEWARPILDSLHTLASALRQDGQPDGEYGSPTQTADAADALEDLLYSLLHEEASRE
jgi:hypothetical protein